MNKFKLLVLALLLVPFLYGDVIKLPDGSYGDSNSIKLPDGTYGSSNAIKTPNGTYSGSTSGTKSNTKNTKEK